MHDRVVNINTGKGAEVQEWRLISRNYIGHLVCCHGRCMYFHVIDDLNHYRPFCEAPQYVPTALNIVLRGEGKLGAVAFSVIACPHQ
jgi:hypothetical protein